MRDYKITKTLYKAGEAPVAVVVIALVINWLSGTVGGDVDSGDAMIAGAVVYGLFRGLRNWIKNR